MPMKDDFDPAQPLPQFLAAQAELDTGNAPDEVASPSRVIKAGVLIAAAAASGIAVLAIGNPMALFAEGSASLVGNSPPQSTPTIQAAADAPASVSSADAPASVSASADAQAFAPITRDAPPSDEIAASEPAGKDQAENVEPASETLFTQFQAWAAKQDAQASGEPVQPAQDASAQTVQNDPVPAAENARSRHRVAQKRRHVRAVRNARAEMHTQKLRKQVRRAQGEGAERQPVQDARAQDQSAQNAQAPSFLPFFGQHN